MAITKIGMRNAWFQVHKWIGLLLAIAIIPISITGSALVWHDALDDMLNPQRVVGTAPALTPARYAEAAAPHMATGEKLASLTIPEQGAVVASAARPPIAGEGRPVRTMIWLAPEDARKLDSAASDAGAIRFMHVLHGTLFIPEWGRATVGWIGAAMLLSAISGIWLWWPTVGSWLRGLRWRRHDTTNANLHHLFGFWIAIPLFILSATGVWISFPKIFSTFDAPRAESGGGKSGSKKGGDKKREPSRAQRMAAQPLTAPTISLGQAVTLANSAAPGRIARIGWPTDVEPEWTIALGPDKREAQTEVKIDAASGSVDIKPPKQEGESLSRLMRRIHDGTDMGIVWQILVFLGGILPAILSVTGIIMWWRTRGWRAKVKARRAAS